MPFSQGGQLIVGFQPMRPHQGVAGDDVGRPKDPHRALRVQAAMEGHSVAAIVQGLVRQHLEASQQPQTRTPCLGGQKDRQEGAASDARG